MRRFFLPSSLALGALTVAVAASAAEMTCTLLGAYLATLVPTITPYTAPGVGIYKGKDAGQP